MAAHSSPALPEDNKLASDDLHAPGWVDTAGRRISISRLEPWIDITWIVIGLILCLYAQRLGVWGMSGPDSGFFPMLAGVIVLAGGIAQLLTTTRRRHSAEDLPFWDNAGAPRRVLTLLTGIVALILLTRYAGFIVASLTMLPFLLRQVEKRSWLYAITVAVIATIAVHVLFVKLLGMQMPRGPLGF